MGSCVMKEKKGQAQVNQIPSDSLSLAAIDGDLVAIGPVIIEPIDTHLEFQPVLSIKSNAVLN